MASEVEDGICFHCLQPIPHGIELSVAFQGEDKAVCCAGCQAVAETIIEHGLTAYYKHRDLDKPQQTPLLPEQLKELDVYDNPDVQSDFVRSLGNSSKQTTLTVNNITCGACAWLIERELAKTPGMIKSVVNVSNQRLHIEWDSQAVKLSDIIARLARIGYQALPFQQNQIEANINARRKGFIKRLGVAGLATMQVMMIAFALYFGVVSDLDPTTQHYLWVVSLVFATPVILYSGQPFYKSALKSIQAGSVNMDVPVSIALIGAYIASVYAVIIGRGEVYFESISMFTFFLLTGRFLELLAKEKALKFSTNRLTYMPNLAHREYEDGLEDIAAKQLKVNDIIVVKPGETIPADGILLSDKAAVDESLLTGESRPVTKATGDGIVAGAVNQSATLRIKVTATAQQTVLAGIVAMQDAALADKPKVQKAIDHIAQYFVMTLLVIAAGTFLVWSWIDPEHALWVTLAVLVATCPCALSLAAPTSITGAVHRLNRMNVLVKGAQLLESVKQLDTVVFDKTGTLTFGQFKLISREDFSDVDETNAIVSGLEQRSEHPIAAALAHLSEQPRQPDEISNHPGQGIAAVIQGTEYRLGRVEFIQTWHPNWRAKPHSNVILASRQAVLAEFQVDDQVREDSHQVISALKQQGIRTIMLTGDSEARAQKLAQVLGVDEVLSEQSPADKVDTIKHLQQQRRTVWMIGDGINDSPVLAQADLSMTFAHASDMAQTAADVVLLNDQLARVLDVIETARKTRVIMRENFIWAAGYNLSILPIAALGLVAPWAAALGMSLSSLVVVANSLRLYRL
ncbi:ATPase [Idiomarina sp. MD25a]|uniref:heavy metal translocating P-type ATPase n=1 Tax=Idiomarina sp. MD25a TaxID=1889913 RepID=UPI0008F809A3|nr:heavy metal translocating P-type ATPase metal-binding domain-containing protein [Idiomarina sp. MD25a]OIN02143.1 ATPase [Idiomarina sp. MD25a]